MSATATPGGAGVPPAESSPIAALECDLRALRSIHRHLCILADDYADVTAGTYLGDAANSTALAIDRLAIIGRSVSASAPTVTATSTGKAATAKEQAATEAIHRVISERLRRCRRPGGAK